VTLRISEISERSEETASREGDISLSSLYSQPEPSAAHALELIKKAAKGERSATWNDDEMRTRLDAALARIACAWVAGAADGDLVFADAWDACTAPFHRGDRPRFLAALRRLEERATYLCDKVRAADPA
jgi:hypothetical protein